MASSDQEDRCKRFVAQFMEPETGPRLRLSRQRLRRRIQDSFGLLPQQVQDEFLELQGRLQIVVSENSALFMPMRTHSVDHPQSRNYFITLTEEHASLDSREFAAAFLRELGHVAAGRPPESSWPTDRRKASEFRELIEARADLMVWKWGLKELSLAFLRSAYPAHRVDVIMGRLETLAVDE